MQSIDGGDPRAVGPDGVRLTIFSRDGRSLAGTGADGVWRLYPIDDGRASELRGVVADDEPAGWTTDGNGILVGTNTIPARLERIDLATGARRVVRELRPPGLANIRVDIYTATADGEQFAYSGLRATRTLYVVK
jgi:hypothetical protein